MCVRTRSRDEHLRRARVFEGVAGVASPHAQIHPHPQARTRLSLKRVLSPTLQTTPLARCADPVKVTTNVCQNCDGRGVIVCQNCEGTGIQPRFLERFSPDDFMD